MSFHSGSYLLEAVQYHQRGELQQASEMYLQILQFEPQHAEAHRLMSLCALQMGQLEQAEKHALQALQGEFPHPHSWETLGDIYMHRGRLKEAEEAYAHSAQAGNAEALFHFKRAELYRRRGALENAAALYRKALEQIPQALWGLLEIALQWDNQSQLYAARELYQFLSTHAPQTPEIWQYRGHNAFLRGCAAEALEHFQRALTLSPHNYELQMWRINACHTLAEYDDARLTHTMQEIAACCFQLSDTPRELPLYEHGEFIHVGYVGSNFGSISAAHVTAPLLYYSDKTRIKLFVYNNAPEPDRSQHYFRACCENWHDVYGLSTGELKALIQHDEIDILVDLNGPFKHNRFDVMADRAAPIQVTGLCFGASSGLDTVDYVLSDRHVLPPERLLHFTEQFVEIPSTFCWRPPDFEIELQAPPCLTRGYITLGSGNSWFKHTNDVLELWAQLLKRLPRAQLYFKCPELDDLQLRAEICQRFEAWGVDAQRLRFAGRTGYLEHLRYYHELDISLSPFPYDAGVTMLESLWMGVPGIGLAQARQRAMSSILNTLQRPEFLADSAEAYVELVCRWANDPEALTALRPTLRPLVLNSRICDPQAYVQSVEARYKEMISWRKAT